MPDNEKRKEVGKRKNMYVVKTFQKFRYFKYWEGSTLHTH